VSGGDLWEDFFAAEPDPDAEAEARAVRDAVAYEAGELPALLDPRAGLWVDGGPADGDVAPPAWPGGEPTWPVRWRPEPGEPGEYVLCYRWLPAGAVRGVWEWSDLAGRWERLARLVEEEEEGEA